MIAILKTVKKCGSFSELLFRVRAGEDMVIEADGQRFTLIPHRQPAPFVFTLSPLDRLELDDDDSFDFDNVKRPL